MGWSLVEGPCPTDEAIARCDALLGEAAGQRAAELTLRGCRAALVTFACGDGDTRSEMADARAGLAELHFGEIAVLALLDAVAATVTGDLELAERAVRDADTLVAESGTAGITRSSTSISRTSSSRGSGGRRPRGPWRRSMAGCAL